MAGSSPAMTETSGFVGCQMKEDVYGRVIPDQVRDRRPAMTEASGLVGEFQPAGGFEAMRVEGADFGGPAHLPRHHQAVAGDAR